MSTREPDTPTEDTERKYQVFISSTFRDLADQRRMVLDVVVDRGHMPIALERFPAADSDVPLVIAKAMDASQIYIVILGYRYGEIVPGRDISFSQLEYEIAVNNKKIVVPFLLDHEEVRAKRATLGEELDQAKVRVLKLAEETPERVGLEKAIDYLETELANSARLEGFRLTVMERRFSQLFSFEDGRSVEQFDRHMVLKALMDAEKEAVKRRVSGWIREPTERGLAETLEAVSRNRFLLDVVGAMAEFDALAPRILDQADEKEAAASFFVDEYLQPILEKSVGLFFESGSSVAYVAQLVGECLRVRPKTIQISTNNVLAYLIFLLVHRIQCSLFPWGPPERRYGAVFGPVNDCVPEIKKPSFPPNPLSAGDRKAIELLQADQYSPARWEGPALMLGALSGLQLGEDPRIPGCFGPHVGSPRNKVFKRFMYATELPVMFFMAENKINSRVDLKRFHFILEQTTGQDLPWQVFVRDRPVAFCVGCKNMPRAIDQTVNMFETFGLKVIRAEHKTEHTAFIARNQKFIDELESGMNIR